MKKLLPFIIIILVAILGIIVAISVNDEKVQTSTSKVQNKAEQGEEKENNLNNVEEVEIEKKEPSENIQNELQDENENEVENTVEESVEGNKEKTNEEVAIDLVKAEWGIDGSVNFVYDGKNSEGKYIISVRDKNTTKALEWYIVDLQNGTCEPR